MKQFKNINTQQNHRDFGVLKVRRAKIPQSQAEVFRDVNQGNIANNRFSKMSDDDIVKISQGENLSQIRELSKWYARTNGIYARAVRYLADIYRFDFVIYPTMELDIELSEKAKVKILKNYNAVLDHFDNSNIQLMLRKFAAQVCLEGVYYGYICEDVNDRLMIQDLPTDYCRSRFTHMGSPLIEFDITYFDKITRDEDFREKLLNLFPPEFKQNYKKFKAGGLKAEMQGESNGWFLLDINRAFKFNFYDNDVPPFLYAIPALIDLAQIQDLEKEKLMQQLQKILVQHFDLDKNGELPFTMGELERLNMNAVEMVGNTIGLNVLSTVAEVQVNDLNDNNGKDAIAAMEAAENAVYNDLGISTNLFNTSGNLALEKSIITDAAYVKQLLLQFERFLNNYIVFKFNKGKKNDSFHLTMLTTTIFNHVDLSNAFKDLTRLGFSRFLPMIALGQSQKQLLSLARVEQQLLQLDSLMLPPFSSNTLSSDTWTQIKEIQSKELSGGAIIPEDLNLEPESESSNKLPDDQKSDKTIANEQSM